MQKNLQNNSNAGNSNPLFVNPVSAPKTKPNSSDKKKYRV
jgi:hypothetical protein